VFALKPSFFKEDEGERPEPIFTSRCDPWHRTRDCRLVVHRCDGRASSRWDEQRHGECHR
jgi:hypothetical protein